MGNDAGGRTGIRVAGLVGRHASGPGDPRDRAGLQPARRRTARRPRSQAETIAHDDGWTFDLMPLLEIENLSVAFPSQNGMVRAVDGVSITLDKGEVLGIVGESGSGKSVGMLALMGLVPYP